MTDEVKRTRPTFLAVLKSKEVDSNYTTTIEANTRKELAKALAVAIASPGGENLELLVAVRGKKLVAQERKTVQFT